MSTSPLAASDGGLTILGGGNIGSAIARGFALAGHLKPGQVTITRRTPGALGALADEGFRVTDDNQAAVRQAKIVVAAVPPSRLPELLDDVAPALDPAQHILVSVVTGAKSRDIVERLGTPVPVVLAMPNTAIAIGESMTCVATSSAGADELTLVRGLFDAVGVTVVIEEDQMASATALCACGVAFFLRAIRAASQGGIEIGFHPHDAIRMAAQTARGAASLLVAEDAHPERQIDAVTTPRGCTIAGLNELEHRGFSSALIKGLVTSASIAGQLYPRDRTDE